MSLDKNMTGVIAALWCGLIAYFTLRYIPALHAGVLSPDISILITFAERMLDGSKFSEAYYETNPPLNIMIYIPVVWLSRMTDIPLWDMHFYYSLFWFVLSMGLTALLLRKNTFLESHWKHMIMMAFMITAFMTPSKSFGDRDHYVFLFLVPFILVQIDLMSAKALPLWLKIPALVIGAFMILLKPHYGLLPTVLLCARIAKERSPKFLIQPDFLALSIGVLSYAAMLGLYFPDFITVVLPDTITLYATNPHPLVKFESIAYGIMTALCIAAVYEMKFPEKQKQLCLFLSLCTLILLIPYVVQGKGLLYHRIAHISFFYTTAAFTIYCAALKYSAPYARYLKPQLLPAGFVALLVFLCMTYNGLPKKQLTDEAFVTYPISEKLMEHCDQPCSYLMLYDYSDIIHQLAVYHGAFHASRFTSLWFLPLIIYSEYQIDKGEEGKLTPEEVQSYKDKYMSMVGEDMAKYKPDVILDFKDYTLWDDSKFDFIAYLSTAPRFAEQMQYYEKVDTLTLDRDMYYPGFRTPFTDEGEVHFDIYKRIKSADK